MKPFEIKRMESMTPKQRSAYRKFISNANSAEKCRKSRGITNCYGCNDFNSCETPKNCDKYLKLANQTIS